MNGVHKDAQYATEQHLRHIMLDYIQMNEFVKEPFVVAREVVREL